MMDKRAKIYVAGHNGMVGSAIVRKLQQEGYSNLVLRNRKELDLREQQSVKRFFEAEKPEFVFLAAAKVGGILANSSYKAEFLNDNLLIQTHVIHQAHLSGVKKLLFLGSSCIYPRNCPQPMKEEYLLTGKLESTNEPYAIAKIAGIKMCDAYRDQYGCNFISVMPTNLYGPNDNYHLQNSHVFAALVRKFHEAKMQDQDRVIVWGTGQPRREFLHTNDFADACVFLMTTYNERGFVNVGSGEEISISDLANLIMKESGYSGSIAFDHSKPDGVIRKMLDLSRISALGWKPMIALKDGVRDIVDSYSTLTK